ITISRHDYLDQVKDFIGKPFIKVITGLRRSGKSEFLKMIQSEILSRDVPDSDTIFINFEELSTLHITDHLKLADYITSRITSKKKYYYLFLDEVQMIDGWEKVINGLRLKNTDIYITGSNSRLLAGELSTLLGGRCLTFKMHTLSYPEFLSFREQSDLPKATVQEYINFGGFPAISTLPYSLNNAQKIVQDIFNTALYKDVVNRHNIRNNDLLNRIVAFLFDNVGNITSFKNITSILRTGGRKVDPETVAAYVSHLEESFIIKRAAPYDIKGKQLLDSNGKYYLGDHSLQYSVRGIRPDKIQGILENIVFHDLQRRGYETYVGRIGDKEVDFVAEKQNAKEKLYIQVCTEFTTKDVIKREFTPLKTITDNYPKYVVNMDRFASDFIDDGIIAISLDKFLLKESL
ncbi:MAG: ATP-binding protein, partial [Treponema sp.]|nr:ATP-binding protein [Treponema sp.]